MPGTRPAYLAPPAPRQSTSSPDEHRACLVPRPPFLPLCFFPRLSQPASAVPVPSRRLHGSMAPAVRRTYHAHVVRVSTTAAPTRRLTLCASAMQRTPCRRSLHVWCRRSHRQRAGDPGSLACDAHMHMSCGFWPSGAARSSTRCEARGARPSRDRATEPVSLPQHARGMQVWTVDRGRAAAARPRAARSVLSWTLSCFRRMLRKPAGIRPAA